jgi:hypothetical protein
MAVCPRSGGKVWWLLTDATHTACVGQTWLQTGVGIHDVRKCLAEHEAQRAVVSNLRLRVRPAPSDAVTAASAWGSTIAELCAAGPACPAPAPLPVRARSDAASRARVVWRALPARVSRAGRSPGGLRDSLPRAGGRGRRPACRPPAGCPPKQLSLQPMCPRHRRSLAAARAANCHGSWLGLWPVLLWPQKRWLCTVEPAGPHLQRVGAEGLVPRLLRLRLRRLHTRLHRLLLLVADEPAALLDGGRGAGAPVPAWAPAVRRRRRCVVLPGG